MEQGAYDRFTARYSDALEDKEALEQVIAAISQDTETFGVALKSLLGALNTGAYGREGFILADKYIHEAQLELEHWLMTSNYDDGRTSALHYYNNHKNEFTPEQELEALYQCMNDVVNLLASLQEYNDTYLGKYKGVTDAVLTAAGIEDETAAAQEVFEALKALYTAKRMDEDEEFRNRWLSYPGPADEEGNPQINTIFCLTKIRTMMQTPGNNLSIYMSIPDPVAMDVSQADYELKLIVDECQIVEPQVEP